MISRRPKTAQTCRRWPQDVQHGRARAASERAQRATRAERCRCSWVFKVLLGSRKVFIGFEWTHGVAWMLKVFPGVHPVRRAVQGISRRACSAQGNLAILKAHFECSKLSWDVNGIQGDVLGCSKYFHACIQCARHFSLNALPVHVQDSFFLTFAGVL